MSLKAKIAWYRHRLAGMSAPEVAHRLREAGKRRFDRRFSLRQIAPERGGMMLPVIPGLRDALLSATLPESVAEAWRLDAAASRDGRIRLLHQDWPKAEDSAHWHLDPVTGKMWPREAFCFAIDFRHQSGYGDIKYVWELNRLQMLQPLAALACREKDAALAAFCIKQIESWIDANPPHRGVNWASGIELALRVISLIVVSTLIGEYFTPAFTKTFVANLETHGRWIARYPSAYSSANNHRTAEGLGLFLLGSLMPALPQAAVWHDEGWQRLCEAAERQILPDGVGAEQTITYTAALIEELLLGLHVARQTGLAVPPAYLERLRQAGMYLRWFTGDGGIFPRIGDDDEACCLGRWRADGNLVCAMLGALAGLFGDETLRPPVEDFHLLQLLFPASPTANPPSGRRTFAEGGYTVGKQATPKGTMLLAIDHGPLGYLSIAAHGHADTLAVWLQIGEVPVLADAGTYLYHSGGDGRSYFRSTKAHNTLRLANTDASRMAGHFNWSHKAKGQIDASGGGETRWWLEASHDGYKRLFGVIHRRRLEVEGAGFSVTDWIDGTTPQPVEIGFLLHPDIEAAQEGETIRLSHRGAALMLVTTAGPLALRLHAAGSAQGGWVSERFGEKRPAARMVLEGKLTPGARVTTHFSLHHET